MTALGDLLQWGGLVVAAATCFIAASLSFSVYMAQNRASREAEEHKLKIRSLVEEQAESKRRDEFHRWVIMQLISVQEDTIFVIRTLQESSDLADSTAQRVEALHAELVRDLYELKIFSGDKGDVKAAARQLASVYQDARTLEVLRLAARASCDLPISSWLEEEVKNLSRRLYPPALVQSRRWTGG